MKTSKSIKTITPAFLKAQSQIEKVKKTSRNPFFKSSYADLSSVIGACKKTLNDNKIAVLQPIVNDVVETILLHESGEWFKSKTKIVVKELNNPQAYGSAITYARRYGLQSMVLLSADDDDGETAMVRPKPQTQKTQTVTAKCLLCGAMGAFHKPNCPNANKKPPWEDKK